MAQGTRGLVASACLLPNLVMTAAEWAGDKVQGQGASRECFDARDPIPQRGRKPLRKPPNATQGRGAINLCSHSAILARPSLEGAGQATGPRARCAGSKKAAWRTNRARRSKLARCLLQVARCNTTYIDAHMCMGGGESRMQQQPVDGQGQGACEEEKPRQGCLGWGQLSSR